MKKILIFSNGTFIEYKFRKEVLSELVKEYEVVLCAPFTEYVDELKALGCRMINIQFSRRGTNILDEVKLISKFNKIIKSEKPDLILTFTIKPNIYAGIVSSFHKVPFLPNITGLGKALQGDGALTKVTVMLYRIAFRKVQYVLFQNEANLNILKEKDIIKESHITKLIPGSGVNTSEYEFYPLEEKEDLTFLFLGRVMQEKGIEEYIEASKIVAEKYPKTKLYAIGNMKEDYNDAIENSVVEYLPKQKDVKPFIRNSDALVNPSYHEGMSNVLLEAGAMGRPLLASDIPGCKEIVQDGYNGYLFEKASADDLAKAMIKMIETSYEERRTMGINSRKHVEDNFDKSIVVKTYIVTIKEILR